MSGVGGFDYVRERRVKHHRNGPLPHWKQWVRSYLERGGRFASAPLPHTWTTKDGRPRCARCSELLIVGELCYVDVPACESCSPEIDKLVNPEVT